jgi:hypothetical protein
MKRNLTSLWLLAVLLLPLLTAAACSGQKTDAPAEVAEQAPPPADTGTAGQQAAPQEAPPPPPARTQTQRPRHEQRSAATIPEERPRTMAPPAQPEAVAVTIPQGTALTIAFAEPLTSETAQPGDRVSVELKNPIVVGDRVVFPAGSRVEGKVTDVKSAKKGFKDTGGALAVGFGTLVAPDGRRATIVAGFTKVAEGSGKKKGAIIGGSAAGAAVLGRLLGKDTAGSALVGGAIGTAVAAGTKGKEATIAAGDQMSVTLEQAARTEIAR